jgi:hypothetical protein
MDYLSKLSKYSRYPEHIGFHIDYARLYEELGKRQLARMFSREEKMYLENPSNDIAIDEFVRKQKDAADFTVAFVQQELNEWLQKTRNGK